MKSRPHRRPIIAQGPSVATQTVLTNRVLPLVGVSFDLQKTLYGFRFGHNVGDAYRRCAEEFIATVEHEEKVNGAEKTRAEFCHVSSKDLKRYVPSGSEINDRFTKHRTYKTILEARVKRYNRGSSGFPETKKSMGDDDSNTAGLEKERSYDDYILNSLSDFDIAHPCPDQSLLSESDAVLYNCPIFRAIRNHRQMVKLWWESESHRESSVAGRGALAPRGIKSGGGSSANEATSLLSNARRHLLNDPVFSRANQQTFESYREKRREAKSFAEAYERREAAAAQTPPFDTLGVVPRSGYHPSSALTDATVAFGGFTLPEVEEDWMGALVYVFGAGELQQKGISFVANYGNSDEKGKKMMSTESEAFTAHLAIDILARAIYDAFLTPRPYALLPNTRRTLLSLRAKYGTDVPVVAVTNNDERIIPVIDTMKLFGSTCDCCCYGKCQKESKEKDVLNVTSTPVASFNNGNGRSSLTDPKTDEEDMEIARKVFGPGVDVRSLAVGDLLDFVVTPSVTGAAKPHPSTLYEAIRLCGEQQQEELHRLSPTSAASFGDSRPPLSSSLKFGRLHSNPLIDASLPHNFKGWVHVGDHVVDAGAVSQVPNSIYVKCDPTKGPSLAAIEEALTKVNQS